MKKSFLAISLSLSLLIPTAAFGHDHGHSHNHSERMEMGVFTPAPTPSKEHAFLAVEAMRKRADGAEDLDQIAGALLANSDDIADSVASVYGEEGRETALAELEEYKVSRQRFLKWLRKVVKKLLYLEEGLSMHIDELVEAFEAYVVGDFETAYKLEREAIFHMTMVSTNLSVAITDQFPDNFDGSKAITPSTDLALLLIISSQSMLAWRPWRCRTVQMERRALIKLLLHY